MFIAIYLNLLIKDNIINDFKIFIHSFNDFKWFSIIIKMSKLYKIKEISNTIKITIIDIIEFDFFRCNILSRLEITLERSQNRCEPSRIISHQNCHLLLCSSLSLHSQSLLDASSQDARTAYVRNCHQGLRGSLVLVASMFQQHLSCIRPQRLYKPALRPS